MDTAETLPMPESQMAPPCESQPQDSQSQVSEPQDSQDVDQDVTMANDESDCEDEGTGVRGDGEEGNEEEKATDDEL